MFLEIFYNFGKQVYFFKIIIYVTLKKNSGVNKRIKRSVLIELSGKIILPRGTDTVN